MLRPVFEFFSPLLPSKLNIQFISLCSKFGFGGKYLYKYYLQHTQVKNNLIEARFFEKYPELNGYGFKERKEKLKNKNMTLVDIELEAKAEKIFDAMSKAIDSKDSSLATVFYNSLVSKYIKSDFSRKAIIERSKDLKFYQENKGTVHEAIEFIIASGKYNKYLLKYFKFQSVFGLNDELLGYLEYFYYKNHTNEGIISFLGDLCKGDDKYFESVNYYSALKSINYSYGSAKLISLFADKNKVDEIQIELSELLDSKIPNKELYRILPMLLRVAPLLKSPEHISTKLRLFDLRDNICSSLNDGQDLNDAKSRLIVRARYLPFFDKLSEPVKSDLGYSISDSNIIENIFHLAYCNDCNDDIALVERREVKYYSQEDVVRRDDIFEVFIPTVFFNLDSSKEIYSSLRVFFINLLETLWEGNYTFIPRMQYNWRNVDPKTPNDLVCYHSVLTDRDGANIVIQESTLTGRVSLDSKGYAGFSAFSELTLDNVQEKIEVDTKLVSSFTNDFKMRKVSKYLQDTSEANFDFDFVFMPLQVETDAVAALRYFEIDDALKQIVSFTQEKGLKLVIKKHPYCKSVKIRELLTWALNFEHVVETNSSIHDLIEHSKFVFTANSGVGLEAIMYSKPVVTFGRSDYSQVSLECKEPSQLIAFFERALQENSKDYSKFIYEYLTNYTVCVNDRIAIDNRIRKLRSLGYE